jgi:3-hydroxyisobutyrate dehydrogenase-like beta-hydroxyacid dehydrogenase
MTTTTDAEKSITLLGLGIMGRAVAKCYNDKGYRVHAWNRSKAKRDLTKAMNLENVIIYDDPSEAVQQSDSNLVLMMVLADEMLATAESVIASIAPTTAWKGKTLVQFTSHEPFAIKAQEKLIMSLHANLIGGAMMAVPTTVGTNEGIFLVSSRDPTLVKNILPALEVLGTVVPFEGDTALASLADIGLLQGLQFGLAGNELSCLIFQRYGVDQNFKDTYVELIPKTTVPIFETLSQEASKAVFSNNYDDQAKTYTAAGHLAVYEAHQYFFERMGLTGQSYLSIYLEQFRKVDGSKGPSAIVETYSFTE